jgi:hypothetical protein
MKRCSVMDSFGEGWLTVKRLGRCHRSVRVAMIRSP